MTAMKTIKDKVYEIARLSKQEISVPVAIELAEKLTRESIFTPSEIELLKQGLDSAIDSEYSDEREKPFRDLLKKIEGLK